MSCAVLLLHRVAPMARQDRWGLTLDPGEFGEFARRIHSSGRVVPLSEAVERTLAGDTERVLAVTFDDGYSDLKEHAFPILSDLGTPFSIFLATRYVHDGKPFWWEVLRELESSPDRLVELAAAWRLPIVGGPEETVDLWCRQMKQLGPERRDRLLSSLDWKDSTPGALSPTDLALLPSSCRLGCHGHSHTVFTALGVAAVARELLLSSDYIHEWAGYRPRELAYPNGQLDDFSEEHSELGRRAGMRAAFTTLDGVNTHGSDPMRLRRISIQPGRAVAQVEALLTRIVP